MKKGQISYFLLTALIFLIAFGFVFYVNQVPNDLILTDNDAKSIKNYLDNCVKATGEDAVSTLGWQGGLIAYDENKMMITHFGSIAYAYRDERNTFPSKQEMENELKKYMDVMLDSCIENLSALQGWGLEKGKIDTKVGIFENSVVFDVNYPIKLRKGQIVKEFFAFRTEVPVRLGYIISAVNTIVEKQVQEPGWIPFTNLNDFGINVTFYPYRKNNFIYEFIDEKSLVKKEPYRFLAANMFEEANLDETA